METKEKELIEKLKKSEYYNEKVIENEKEILFLDGENAEKYAKTFKDLPDTTTKTQAEKAVKRLDKLYSKYEQEGNEEGKDHCIIIAELGRERARKKGKPNVYYEYEEWINKKEKTETH